MKAYIKHISYYLPTATLTNAELINKFPEWSVEKVANKLGIKQRHISKENETSGDLAIKAAEKLFSESNIDRESIDFILLCTQSPDYFLPTTACIIQDKLGIPTSAGALDFNQGCSGYVYGLSLAKGLIAAGIATNILFLTAETYSKYIHADDKSNLSIFGDAATATVVSREGFAEIGDFVLGTDGSGAGNLIVKTGGSKFPEATDELITDEGGFLKSSDHLYMNGSNVFNFTLSAVPELIKAIMLKADVAMEDIDFFVFHQANHYMLNVLRKVCKIDEEKFYVNMEDTGNTVSSTIPIALTRLLDDQNFTDRNGNVIIAGFGVGYSWGSCILKFN
jgi:3-oxoacyl-[acyl-carrier-protein] synthase-3